MNASSARLHFFLSANSFSFARYRVESPRDATRRGARRRDATRREEETPGEPYRRPWRITEVVRLSLGGWRIKSACTGTRSLEMFQFTFKRTLSINTLINARVASHFMRSRGCRCRENTVAKQFKTHRKTQRSVWGAKFMLVRQCIATALLGRQ